MIKRKFTLRIEEMPVVGKFLYDSFVRDFKSFGGYSPDFNATYKSTFEKKLTNVENIVNPKKLLDELKKVTNGMYANIDSLRLIMNNLEGYVKRVKDELTILAEDFGIKQVRDKIGGKEQEGLLENLKVVIQNIDANLTALQAKGWSAAQDSELRKKIAEIKAANALQNVKMDERQAKVEENIPVLNELWEIMVDVMDAGRVRLFKVKNPEKAGDYTLLKLKKRVRNEKTIDKEIPPLK